MRPFIQNVIASARGAKPTGRSESSKSTAGLWGGIWEEQKYKSLDIKIQIGSAILRDNWNAVTRCAVPSWFLRTGINRVILPIHTHKVSTWNSMRRYWPYVQHFKTWLKGYTIAQGQSHKWLRAFILKFPTEKGRFLLCLVDQILGRAFLLLLIWNFEVVWVEDSGGNNLPIIWASTMYSTFCVLFEVTQCLSY